jgi:phosphinothricin acetyltransferase
MERRMNSVLEGGLPYLVAEVGGVVAGYAYASSFRPRAGYRFTVEDSVYLRADYAGKGIGRQLLGALIERCKAAGCRQMVAVIGGENPASVVMHRTLGFAHVGVLREVGFKFGEWQDVTLMQLGL